MSNTLKLLKTIEKQTLEKLSSTEDKNRDEFSTGLKQEAHLDEPNNSATSKSDGKANPFSRISILSLLGLNLVLLIFVITNNVKSSDRANVFLSDLAKLKNEIELVNNKIQRFGTKIEGIEEDLGAQRRKVQDLIIANSTLSYRLNILYKSVDLDNSGKRK